MEIYLGYCYVNGIGIEVDKEKGFKLYNEAAGKKGINIPNTFENDDKIINNLDKVNYWYHKAAENDHKTAQNNLAVLYGSWTSKIYLRDPPCQKIFFYSNINLTRLTI